MARRIRDGEVDPPPANWRLRLRRRLRQWRGLEPRTRVQIRCERREHGGWWVCPDVLRPGDIAYSFSEGSDLRFEAALVREYGARVFAFDGDPAVGERAAARGLGDELRLHTARVGDRDEGPDRPSTEGEARMLRLPSLMRALGHRRVDLIKLAAGDPYAAIQDLVRMEVDVRQLLVAFGDPTDPAVQGPLETAVSALGAHGYRIFHISPDGREYSFIRTDFVAR